MQDEELTRGLQRLGLTSENWRAVSLLPMIEVAWSDGRIQDAERRLLVDVAARYGVQPGSAFLQRWLDRRPARAEFLRARTLLLQLWRRAGIDEAPQPETLEQLLDLCLRVAEAAGGLFGILFTVEASERECMSEIAQSLQLGPELPETVAKSWRPPKVPVKPPVPPGLDGEPTARRTRTPPSPDETTRIRRPPAAAAAASEETTRIRPFKLPKAPKVPKGSKGDTDADATTRMQPRRLSPELSSPEFDDDVTSPYGDAVHDEVVEDGSLDE